MAKQSELEARINEKLVKISAGLTPIEGKLELGEDVQIIVQGNVVKIEYKDCQDGTFDLVYVVKGIIGYVNEEQTET